MEPGKELQRLVEQWNSTLSNGIQLAPRRGVYADDLDIELERLYSEYVALPRKFSRVGAPGSRAFMRKHCNDVWKNGRMWDRLEKSVRVTEFTFPGDPMRLDYCYRKNGTRGFVQTISVSRAPTDCKLYAYTASRIAQRAPFASEFTAVTDVMLLTENERHRFVCDTLRRRRRIHLSGSLRRMGGQAAVVDSITSQRRLTDTICIKFRGTRQESGVSHRRSDARR